MGSGFFRAGHFARHGSSVCVGLSHVRLPSLVAAHAMVQPEYVDLSAGCACNGWHGERLFAQCEPPSTSRRMLCQ